MRKLPSIVVVLENRPRFTPELQRRFWGESVRVRGCRSIADFGSRLNEQPALPCVGVMQLEFNPGGCLQWLSRQLAKPAAPPVLIVAKEILFELEWRARELGAVEFVRDEIFGDDLAELCRRFWNLQSRRTSFASSETT